MKNNLRQNSNNMPSRQYLYVLWLMVKRNVKQQYRNSALGVAWTVLNPLLNMLVLTFVFSSLFNRDSIGMDYACYLLSGNILFTLMRAVTSTALPCIVGSRDLLTKTKVPATIFPISKAFTALSNFLFSLLALLCVMLVQSLRGKAVAFTWTMLLGLAVVPALFLFAVGLGFVLSALYVKFRDVQHLYGVALTLWTYMTPIFYSLQQIQNQRVVSILQLNPMYHFLTTFRQSFVAGVVPSLSSFAICYAWGIVVFALGLLYFSLKRDAFVVNV